MSKKDRQKREFSTAGEFHAFVNGQLEGENNEIFPHVGFTDNSEVLKLMNHMALAYEPENPHMPTNFQGTKAAQAITKSEGTKVATQAVRDGNVSQMKFFTGKQDYSNSANSIHTLISLRQKLAKEAYIGYLFGHMGNGKTDFANLLGELAKKELNSKIVTNQKKLVENGHADKYVWTYGGLLQVLTEHIETDKEIHSLQDLAMVEDEIEQANILFIFDEASQEASGYSSDAHDTQEKLGKLLKLIRKVGGMMIIIGHTGKDVHPDIRRLANDCIHKVSKKTAEFYESVNEAEGVDLKETISGIPETNWSYNTTEVCIWSWDDVPGDKLMDSGEAIQETKQSTEKRYIEMARAYVKNDHEEIEPDHNGEITQEMLAEHYGLTASRVSQIFTEMEQEANKMGMKQ
jgi:hypothetical protein